MAGITTPLLSLLKGQTSFDGAVGLVDVGMVKTDNFVSGHGSACGELLSDEELNLFHVFGNFALGFAAIGPVATGKAVLVFGLSYGKQFFCCCQLLLDGIKKFCECHFQEVMGW